MRLLAFAMVVLTGCSAVVDDVGGESSRDTSALDGSVRAAVSVQRTESVNGSHAMRTHVAARFLRASGRMDDATRMVEGSALDPNAPLGCTWPEDATLPSADGRIELVDVGDIVLHAEGVVSARGDVSPQLALAPRAFPDVGGLVSGVVYTSRDRRTELPDGATYLFEVSGSGAFDGFSLVADAPVAPKNVRLGGAGFETSKAIVLRSNESVDLSWTESTEHDDRIYVTVTSAASSASASPSGSSADDGHAFTCVFEDDGAAELPASFLGFEPGAELDVMVHRHRRAAIVVSGTDYDAVVDFDFAVAAQVVVE